MNGSTLRAAASRQPQVTLTSSETAAVRTAAQALPGSPYGAFEPFLSAARQVAAALPEAAATAVRRFALDPAAPPALLLRGLPIDDDLPPTPTDGRTPVHRASYVAEAVLLGVTTLAGEPIAYHAEKEGALVHTIAPRPGREEAQSNEGSASLLGLHTEIAFADVRPDALGLLCLRGDARGTAGTLLAPFREAVRLLEPGVRALLREPLYCTRAPESFQAGHGAPRWSPPRPVLRGPDDLPEGCYRVGLVRATEPRAEAALAELERALHAPSVLQEVRLGSGDLLLVHNRKAMHGRTPFTPAYAKGQARWLLRVYLRRSLWEGRSAEGAPLRVFAA